MKHTLLAVASVLIALPIAAYAKDDLDELLSLDIEALTVSVASKKNENVSDAPGVVNVLTHSEIRASGAQTLFEALERMPGVLGVRNSVFGIHAVGVRGDKPVTGNYHVLLLLNGRPVREGYSGAFDSVLLTDFPLSAVEKIEMIRGPGSPLYGTNAFTGVVNIVTKKADNTEGEASLTYGGNNTRKGEGRAGYAGEDYSVNLAVRGAATDGFKVEGVDFFGARGQDRTRESNASALANIDYKNLSVNAFSGYLNYDSFLFPSSYPFMKSWRKQNFVDVGYSLPVSENWKVNLNGTYSNMLQLLGAQAQNDDWLGEAALHGKLADNVNLLLGGTYQYTEGEGSRGTPLGYDYVNRNASGYAQLDYSPAEWVKLIVGGQVNKPNTSGADVSPRAGAIFHFGEHWGGKLLYGESFRSAYPAEQYLNIPGVIQGNPDLKPEKAETADAQIFYQSKRFYGALTAFNVTQKDDISTVGIDYVNGSDVDFKGATLEGKATLAKDWQVQASVTYQDNEDGTGNEFFFTPHWFGKAGVTYRGIEGVTVDVFDAWAGKSKTELVGADRNPEPDAYHLVNANVEVALNKMVEKAPEGISLSLRGFNLLDENIMASQIKNPVSLNSSTSRAGRTGFVTLSVRF